MIRPLRTYRAALAVALTLFGASAAAQYGSGPVPGEPLTDPTIPEVGINQQLGARVPAGVPLRDESGRTVTLGDYLDKGRPVVLAMVYYECPMLCGEILNGMLAAFKDLDFTLGQEFDVVAISFNPEETAELAAAKKAIFVENYGRENAGAAWHFLTAPAESSAAVAKAIGFGYEYLPEVGEYAHGSTIAVLTPAGEISKYLFGVTYPAADLRAALLAAGEGRIGTLAEQIVYRCFMYNSATGQYSLRIMYLVRIAGVVTIAALAAVVAVYLRRDKRLRAHRPAGDGPIAAMH